MMNCLDVKTGQRFAKQSTQRLGGFVDGPPRKTWLNSHRKFIPYSAVMQSMLAKVYRRLYLAVNYRMRVAFAGRLAHLCRPTSIAILLTKRCNARCIHCNIWKTGRSNDDLTLKDYGTFLSDLRAWLGPVHVSFTGGEALLNPLALDVCAIASRLGLYTELLTNGYCKDEWAAKELVRAGVSQVTVSLDAIGATHSTIRGRNDFWEVTARFLERLKQARDAKGAGLRILLKTVIMRQNVHEVTEVARFARVNRMVVRYQPVEQNYDSPDDPGWFEHAVTWPKNPDDAVAVVERLAAMTREGFPIENSPSDFNAMRSYFANPRFNMVAVQSHMAHEQRPYCSALGNLQIEPNGDVGTCFRKPSIGNVTTASIRNIWRHRPRWWEAGCCHEQ